MSVSSATLTERVLRVRTDLATLRGDGALVAQAEKFEKRAQQLAQPAKRLAVLIEPARALRAADIPVDGLNVEVLQQWLRAFDALRRKYAENPESILTTDPKLRFAVFEPLQQLPDELAERLSVSWKRWIEDQMPSFGADVLDILEVIPALRTQVQAIREELRRLNLFACSLPASVAMILTVRTFCEQLGQRWETLSGGLSQSILDFLRAAGGRGDGALYAALTDDVKAWLAEHDLLARLLIRLSA